MTDELSASVALFVARECGVPLERLTPSTELEAELGLSGDDAEAFILDFARTFEVDLTAFAFDRHFEDEASCLLRDLWLAVRRPYGRQSVPVTVRLLEEAARARRWPSFPTQAT